jgi:3-mercaptopyruvate sulfurtransferase SseA
MKARGWDEVYALKGGLAAWEEARLPLAPMPFDR